MLDLRGQRRHLLACGAGELDRVGKCGIQFGAGHPEPRIGRQAVKQVVVAAAGFSHLQGNSDRVFLDCCMCRLSTSSVPYGRDQHLGGSKEGQIALQLGIDHRWEYAEILEHMKKGLKQAVEGKERVWERNAAHHGA